MERKNIRPDLKTLKKALLGALEQVNKIQKSIGDIQKKIKEYKGQKVYIHTVYELTFIDYSDKSTWTNEAENHTEWIGTPSRQQVITADLEVFRALYEISAIKIIAYDLLEMNKTTKKEFTEHFKDISKRPLFVRNPTQYYFSVSNDMNIPKDNENCLISAMYNMYSKYIPSLTYDKIKESLDIFRTKENRNYYNFDDCTVWLCKYNIPYYLCDIRNNIVEKDHMEFHNHNYPAFMASIMDDHIYLVKDKHMRLSICNKVKDNKSHIIQNEDIEKATELNNYALNIDLNELDNIDNDVVIYDKLNLKKTLVHFFTENNKMFKNTFYNNNITKIFYVGKNNKKITLLSNPNKIHNIKPDTIKKFCDMFSIPFLNQSITSIACELFNMCRGPNEKTKRLNFNALTKKTILEQQNGKCNSCNTVCKKYEFDHIKRVCDGGKNNIENCQALCKSCHNKKTCKESEFDLFEKDYLLSSFNNVTLDIFNVKKNAFILHDIDYDAKKDILFGIDINKCRRNILYHSRYNYCVYSSLDEVEPFSGKLKTGYYYLHLYNTPDDELLFFPLKYNGWYSYPIVKFCLKKKIIKSNHIKYELIPSYTVPHNYFQSFVDFVMEKADANNKEIYLIFKKLFNCWIGNLGSKIDHKGTICLTKNIDEASYLHLKYTDRVFKDTNGIYHLINQKNNKKLDSYAPIFNQILDIEAIELYKITKIFNKYNTKQLYLNTDQVVVKINDIEQLPSIKKEFEDELWDSENKNISWKMEEGGKKYKTASDIKHQTSDLTSQYEDYSFILNKSNWNTIDDPLHDDFKILAQSIIDMNCSININGYPGTGKSVLVKNIIEILKENNVKYMALAPTNVASKIIDGQTLYKFCTKIKKMTKTADPKKRKNKNKNKPNFTSNDTFKQFLNMQYIIIDEISMVKEVFYRFFNTIKNNHSDIKFIICGDFAQLPPVNDIKQYDYENSELLKYVCDSTRLQLSKCRRSDISLFNDYMDPDNIDMDTYTTKHAKINRRYKRTIKKFICYHNNIRKQVNDIMMNKTINTKNIKHILLENTDDKNQDIYLYKGLPLIGYRNNSKLDIYNGEDYIVKSFDDEKCILSEIVYDNNIIIPISQITHYLQPAYCVTVYKAQGKTFNFPFGILERDSNKFNKCMKFVAMSRSTKKEFVNIIYNINNISK